MDIENEIEQIELENKDLTSQRDMLLPSGTKILVEKKICRNLLAKVCLMRESGSTEDLQVSDMILKETMERLTNAVETYG